MDESRPWHPSHPESTWGGILDTAIYYRDRLADAQAALEQVQAQQPETLRMIERNGFVFETDLSKPDAFRTDAERWEKLAFSIYTDLCEVETIASSALAALASSGADSGKERPDRRTDEEKALARTAYLSAPWASGKERATVCEECGSGLLNGEHIADYPCSRRDSGKGRTLSEEKVARAFHETYERLAPQFGYETRPESAVPWEQVPETNKRLMVAVASEVLALLERERCDG